MKTRGYSDVENIWNPLAKQLLGQTVMVQEKLDGSQFAFTFDSARSKRMDIVGGAVPDLFAPAIKWLDLNKHSLPPNLIFHAEAVARPRHNTLTYERAPQAGFVVFDIEKVDGGWLNENECRTKCDDLGILYVQVFNSALHLTSWGQLEEFLDRKSMLGGGIEGVVAKPLDRSIVDPLSKRPLMAKVVRPEFREKNNKAQKEYKRTQSLDCTLEELVESYKAGPRFEKSLQRLRDEGKICGELKDLAVLIPEVREDILKEEELAFKELLWAAAKKQIGRRVAAWLPEWYKARLLGSPEDKQE